MTLFIPGLITALLVQWLSRASGVGIDLFDHDELPGPVSFAVGFVVNAVVWACAVRAARGGFRKPRGAASEPR